MARNYNKIEVITGDATDCGWHLKMSANYFELCFLLAENL